MRPYSSPLGKWAVLTADGKRVMGPHRITSLASERVRLGSTLIPCRRPNVSSTHVGWYIGATYYGLELLEREEKLRYELTEHFGGRLSSHDGTIMTRRVTELETDPFWDLCVRTQRLGWPKRKITYHISSTARVTRDQYGGLCVKSTSTKLYGPPLYELVQARLDGRAVAVFRDGEKLGYGQVDEINRLSPHYPVVLAVGDSQYGLPASAGLTDNGVFWMGTEVPYYIEVLRPDAAIAWKFGDRPVFCTLVDGSGTETFSGTIAKAKVGERTTTVSLRRGEEATTIEVPLSAQFRSNALVWRSGGDQISSIRLQEQS